MNWEYTTYILSFSGRWKSWHKFARVTLVTTTFYPEYPCRSGFAEPAEASVETYCKTSCYPTSQESLWSTPPSPACSTIQGEREALPFNCLFWQHFSKLPDFTNARSQVSGKALQCNPSMVILAGKDLHSVKFYLQTAQLTLWQLKWVFTIPQAKNSQGSSWSTFAFCKFIASDAKL